MVRSAESSTQLLHRLFDEGSLAGLDDAALVERFIEGRDPAAFAAIVARWSERSAGGSPGWVGVMTPSRRLSSSS